MREEGLTMAFTMEDFKRQYIMEHFAQLTPEEQREALEQLSPENRRELLSAFSPEQLREYLDPLEANRPTRTRAPRRKK
jgi:Mg/Co/Ni transporter MgtE